MNAINPTQTITTADIVKGDRVRLRGSGWYANILDGKTGKTRLAEVEGFFTERGSIYVQDIGEVYRDGAWRLVEVHKNHRVHIPF